MSFTFIPRFNYPELSNNSLRLCRICGRAGIGRQATLRSLCAHARGSSSLPARTICRCGGMVDTNALGAFATWRAGSSPVIGTISDIINKIKNKISVRSYRALDRQVLYPVTPLRRGVKPSALYAEMMELVDMPASKADAITACGFKSHFRYQRPSIPHSQWRTDRPSRFLVPSNLHLYEITNINSGHFLEIYKKIFYNKIKAHTAIYSKKNIFSLIG